jgi:fatty acid desaturase
MQMITETRAAMPGVRDGDRLYRALRAELHRAGCFRPATARTIVHAAVVLGAHAAAYAILLTAPAPPVRLLALAALAFLSVQASFIAHEAGHGAITRRRGVATGLGLVFNTLLTGFSHTYFRHIHRRHHPYTNDPERDPDIRSGLFSLYAQSAAEKTGVGRLVSRHQAILIWVLVALQGFSLKYDGVMFLRAHARTTRVDQAVLALHLALWFGPPAVLLGLPAALGNYAAMTLLAGPYLGAVLLVNHIGTRVIEPAEPVSYLERELSTTRNLGTSRILGFVFGGLENHVEHHLFPTMPTARLRAARPITRAFCRRYGLIYREMSWLAAAREVARYLAAMSALVPRR